MVCWDRVVYVRGLGDRHAGRRRGWRAMIHLAVFVGGNARGWLGDGRWFDPDDVRTGFGNPDSGRAAVLVDSPLVGQFGGAGLLLAVLAVCDGEGFGFGDGGVWGDDVAELVTVAVGLVVELADIGCYGVGDWWCDFVLGRGFCLGDGDGDGWSVGAIFGTVAFVIVSAGDGRCSSYCYAHCKREDSCEAHLGVLMYPFRECPRQ